MFKTCYPEQVPLVGHACERKIFPVLWSWGSYLHRQWINEYLFHNGILEVVLADIFHGYLQITKAFSSHHRFHLYLLYWFWSTKILNRYIYVYTETDSFHSVLNRTGSHIHDLVSVYAVAGRSDPVKSTMHVQAWKTTYSLK